MKFATWALDLAEAHRPGATVMVGPAVQTLVDSLFWLRRASKDDQVFGLTVSRLEPEGRPAVEAAVVGALLDWREHFEAEHDPVSLLALDKAGRWLELPDLRLTKRFPLRCDPLGARDGLSPDWLRRIERLGEAKAGRRRLDPGAVHVVGAGHDTRVAFGTPDEAGLYEFALRYEEGEQTPFPREFAALWSTADGIAFDDVPVLRPVKDWRRKEHGLSIGSGGYVQGALTLDESELGLLDAEVVDRDDDGEVRARYANLGAFLDTLLGS